MKMNLVRFIPLIIMMMVACTEKSDDQTKDNNEGKNVTKISTHNDTNSHRVGEDCISCHASGETGKGWFTASGSVYKSDKTTAYPNGTVKLYSAANQGGTLVKSIQVDGLGNFYTTESISFSSGLYPVVEYNGQTNTMQRTTTSGRCYTCHVSGGVAGNVIYGP